MGYYDLMINWVVLAALLRKQHKRTKVELKSTVKEDVAKARKSGVDQNESTCAVRPSADVCSDDM